MAIIYRTAGTWGAGKGSPLTAEEIDNNFFELLERAADLSENPAQPVNIESIEMNGTSFLVNMTDATTRGPFQLPVAYFKWRGEWQPNTEYENLDLVYVQDDGLYVVKVFHVSGATFTAPDLFYSKFIGQASIYDMTIYLPGEVGEGLDEDSPLVQTIIARPMFITGDDPGEVYARVAPEVAELYCVFRKNGEAIGYMDMAAGANVGELHLDANVLFEAGDVFSIDQPILAPQTETETETPSGFSLPRDLSITIKAVRGAPIGS